jgi:phage gp46-like protein
METALDPSTGDYLGSSTTTLLNAVYIRLKTPLGSYPFDKKLGSRLHELAREKDVPRIKKLAVQYSEQALAPLVTRGEAKSITVTAEQPHNGWLKLLIVVVDAGGREQTFKYPVKVG